MLRSRYQPEGFRQPPGCSSEGDPGAHGLNLLPNLLVSPTLRLPIRAFISLDRSKWTEMKRTIRPS